MLVRPTAVLPARPVPRNHREGSGIVYALSRDDTETVAAQIRQLTDISAAHYHAGTTAGASVFMVTWHTTDMHAGLRCTIVAALVRRDAAAADVCMRTPPPRTRPLAQA